MNTISVQLIIGLFTFIGVVLSSVFIPINLQKKAKYASYIMDSRKNRIIETKEIILEYLKIFEQLEVASNNGNKEIYHERCLDLKRVQNRITLHFKPANFTKKYYFKSHGSESNLIFKDGISSFNNEVKTLKNEVDNKDLSNSIDDVENLLSNLTVSVTTYLSSHRIDELDFNFEIIKDIIPLLSSVLLKNEWELLKGEVNDEKRLIEKEYIKGLTENLVYLINDFDKKFTEHTKKFEETINNGNTVAKYKLFEKDKNQTVPMFLKSVLDELDKEYEFPENIMSKNKNYYLSSDPNTEFLRKRKYVGTVANKGKIFWFEANASSDDSERLARHISKGIYEYNNIDPQLLSAEVK